MSQWLELEKQKNLNQLKTVAFAQAAHEIRNPLNGIVASLEILENKKGYMTRDNQFLLTAKNCANLMLFLVRDIMDFSQIESKTFLLDYSNINLRELIEECIRILKFKAEDKGIQLRIKETSCEIPVKFNTDANRIKQILINLISNAIKYTEKGSVLVSCEQYRKPRHFNIIIEDTGVGISADNLNKLFQAFTKIMNNRHLNRQGVGLGLTISKNIAKALGGDILAESEEAKGSKFTVILPEGSQVEEGKDLLSGSFTEKESMPKCETSTLIDDIEGMFQIEYLNR